MPSDFIVHIVDDEETVRQSIAYLLSTEGFAVRVYNSALDFLGVAPQIRNGCLLTDLRMPDINGVDLLRQLQTAGLRIPTIVMSGHGDVPMAVAAMKAGATDFIQKPFQVQALLDSVSRAAVELQHNEYVPHEIERKIGALTERERQVFLAIASGQPNKAVAYDLQISPRTVEVHRASIMAKMEARNLADLVRLAIAARVIPG